MERYGRGGVKTFGHSLELRRWIFCTIQNIGIVLHPMPAVRGHQYFWAEQCKRSH